MGSSTNSWTWGVQRAHRTAHCIFLGSSSSSFGSTGRATKDTVDLPPPLTPEEVPPEPFLTTPHPPPGGVQPPGAEKATV